MYTTPNELNRGENSVKGFSLYQWIKFFYLYMRGKRSHNHESLFLLKFIQYAEVLLDVVAISVIIYLEVLTMLFAFMIKWQKIFIGIRL